MKHDEKAIRIIFTEHTSEKRVEAFLEHFLEMGFEYEKENDKIYKLIAGIHYEELNEYVFLEEKKGSLVRLLN
jgi:hypothetical protein